MRSFKRHQGHEDTRSPVTAMPADEATERPLPPGPWTPEEAAAQILARRSLVEGTIRSDVSDQEPKMRVAWELVGDHTMEQFAELVVVYPAWAAARLLTRVSRLPEGELLEAAAAAATQAAEQVGRQKLEAEDTFTITHGAGAAVSLFLLHALEPMVAAAVDAFVESLRATSPRG